MRADASRAAVSLESDDPDRQSRDESLDLAAVDPSSLERLERSEVVRRVLAAIDRLPARYRVPLTLYHIDGLRETLEHSDVRGAFAPYADILHEGPVPRGSGTDASRATRARFIADSGYGTYAEALRTYERWDTQLASFAHYDEVVLWFEHDLFDQLLLIRHLDWFSRRDLGSTTVSLICIGEFPGYESFHGLGELEADQLASLLGTRQRVTGDQLASGRRAWEAFTATNPADLVALASEPTPALPFLSGALRRMLEEYPSRTAGLPRTERHVLELLAHEPQSPERLFLGEQRLEERVFMGDSTFWQRVRGLAHGTTSLVRLEVEPREGPGCPRERCTSRTPVVTC